MKKTKMKNSQPDLKKKMEMILVMKSKNVCLLYLPVISWGKPWGNKDR